MACGLSVVTYDDAIRREQLAEHATLVPMPASPCDAPPAFARAIDSALETAEATRSARLAFVRARYDLAVMARSYDELFESLL